MNFTKDIYINKDKIVEDSEIVILYKGFLFSNTLSKDVYISYGYGNLWENKNELKMKPSTFGYLATIHINSGNDLQFCFRDNDNNWDNNNSANYILPIEENEDILSFKTLSNTSKEIDFSISEIQETPNEKSEDILEKSIVSSKPIEFYRTVDLENITKQAIPNNTIIKQINLSNESNTNVSESIIKSNLSEDTISIKFSELTEKAKEQSVKAFDDDKVTAGSVYVHSLVKDIQDSPEIIENIEEKSLIKSNQNELDNNLSFFGLLAKNLKLAFNKVITLIKNSLNLNEDNE